MCGCGARYNPATKGVLRRSTRGVTPSSLSSDQAASQNVSSTARRSLREKRISRKRRVRVPPK